MNMNKPKILALTVIMLFLTSNITSADMGRHPNLILEIRQNGTPLSGDALVCSDTFSIMHDITRIYNSRDYDYIKNISNTYDSCFYCVFDKSACYGGFDSIPEKIAILYPSYGFCDLYKHEFPSYCSSVENRSENQKPVLYQSDLHVTFRRGVFDYMYEADLNPDGSITFIDKTPFISKFTFLYFSMALIITVFLEMVMAFIYILKKRLPLRILWFVVLSNIISLTIFWFVISPVFHNILLSELFVLLLEGYIIYQFNKKKISLIESMILSLIMNAVSFSLGEFIAISLGFYI